MLVGKAGDMDAENVYGREPGLRFACLLDGSGGCRKLDWAGVGAWQAEEGVLWVHLERDAEEAARWVRERSGIDPVNGEALLAEDSRPRVEENDDALLVVLRGINMGKTADLVPIHFWVDSRRVVTLRNKDHNLMALRDIVAELSAGRGPATVGRLLVKIVGKLVKHVEPLLQGLEDEVDDLDEKLDKLPSKQARETLGQLRRRAIVLRRYLAPQREALSQLQYAETSWLGSRDRVHLREVADRILRAVENLDLIRDRTTILHEDLTAHVAEQISRTSHRLTTIATLVLPPSLVAGVLGANIGGIPGSTDSWAFAALVLVVGALIILEVWILKKLDWF
jgi:zinc transporter